MVLKKCCASRAVLCVSASGYYSSGQSGDQRDGGILVPTQHHSPPAGDVLQISGLPVDLVASADHKHSTSMKALRCWSSKCSDMELTRPRISAARQLECLASR